MEKFDVFYDFMTEYTQFFETAVSKEKEKFSAVLNYDIKKLEAALSVQQSLNDRIAFYEQRRMELQQNLGIPDLKLSEIIDMLSGKQRQDMKMLASRFSGAIMSVKDLNSKALEVTQINLKAAEEVAPAELSGNKYYNMRGNTVNAPRSAAFINTKI